ncbi:hypothetical protein Gbem_1912 [Citrifermentans bemidjiense Bem]|uniref:Uncharacterized protein n=1 Tax=Citrifermentans bemidjiense (strain ATCC BAA-1014 / DSM 16622 / JCM 12645 / Bem) TaxID=404380 RepID=B5EB65_CITBB|nr:hypothetical protein Gbem_1912 [Citrifermentans bemidjiense Bem]
MVTTNNLTDFVCICEKSDIDFARITYECGAMKFVNERARFENDGMVKTYKFEEIYLDQSFNKFTKYEVIAIHNKAYLMYEVTGKEITIWVCYTEEKIRNSGYMTQLLNLLINKYKNKKITVDTHNQSLRHICNDLRINLFR